MPNVCLMVLICGLVVGGTARGQVFFDSQYQASPNRPIKSLPYSPWAALELENPMSRAPQSPQLTPGGAATVSTDVLRHPLTSKARRLLQKALHHSNLGDHPAAIEDLHQAVVKEPSSAPYVDNMLGVEYLETNQLNEAKNSFEEAVRLMPNESINHSNLGLSLAFIGEFDSAEKEERKAIQLDHANAKAQSILDVILLRKRFKPADSRP